MDETKPKQTRRTRRTRAQLDSDILAATESLVEKMGFVNIPVTTFLSEAGIDPTVFYRRYHTIYEIYDELTKKYDFWLNDTINLSQLNILGDKKFLTILLQTLRNDLKKNVIMQKLLLWELNDNNETTKRSTAIRDTLNIGLLGYFETKLQEGKFETYGIFALIIAGIYYITLHRGIATFCTIDFTTKEGIKTLNTAIDQLVEMLFMKAEHNRNQLRMVKEMCDDELPHKTICKYLKIKPSELKKILKQLEQ